MDVRKKFNSLKNKLLDFCLRPKISHRQKGLAVLETVPMIFIYITLMGFTIGFYGVSQKMILHSIASRSYGFEQIRHRANLTYLRDVGGEGATNSYHISQLRYFTVRGPGPGAQFVASRMNIDYRNRGPDGNANPDAHNTSAYEDISRQKRNDRHYFESVWVKVGHGICLSASCGD